MTKNFRTLPVIFVLLPQSRYHSWSNRISLPAVGNWAAIVKSQIQNGQIPNPKWSNPKSKMVKSQILNGQIPNLKWSNPKRSNPKSLPAVSNWAAISVSVLRQKVLHRLGERGRDLPQSFCSFTSRVHAWNIAV